MRAKLPRLKKSAASLLRRKLKLLVSARCRRRLLTVKLRLMLSEPSALVKRVTASSAERKFSSVRRPKSKPRTWMLLAADNLWNVSR